MAEPQKLRDKRLASLVGGGICAVAGIVFAILGGVRQNLYFFTLGLYLLTSAHATEIKTLIRFGEDK